MSTATNGRAREHRVIHDLAKYGFRLVMRAAGSKGAADAFVVSATRGGALVQIGTARKTLGPTERVRLLADADDSGNLPICAQVLPGVGIRYWLVKPGPASTWEPWTPGPVEASS